MIKSFLKEAQKEKIPLWQFNFSDLWQFFGILKGAKKFKTPFILGTSEGEIKTLGVDLVRAMLEIAQKRLQIPIFLNLDHAIDINLIKRAIEARYHMIHFDGSSLPFEKNVELTRKIVRMCHQKGILVEGEIGKIPKVKDLKLIKNFFTEPEEAKIFVQKTGVDLLAISIGNIHGIAKKMPNLDLKRLYMIKNKIKKAGLKVFLVLHGGSGIKKEEIKKAAKGGIVKININTEVRIAWKKGILEDLIREKKEIAPYKIIKKAIENVAKVVEEKFKIFI